MRQMLRKYFFPYFSLFQMWLIVLTPFVLLFLPKNYFDNGNSLCLSILLFDVECWGCGITQSVMHLLHLDFRDAYFYNIGSFIVLPTLGLLWGSITYRYFSYVRREKTLIVSYFSVFKTTAKKVKV